MNKETLLDLEQQVNRLHATIRSYEFETAKLVAVAEAPHLTAAKEARQAVLDARAAELDTLRRTAAGAQKMAEDAAIELSKTGHGWLPPGTRVQRWESKYGYGSKPNKLIPVEQGVVEVWTRESPRPDGIRHSIPPIGQLVVRLFKADGTPSKKFAQRRGWGQGEWFPLDVDPNKTRAE